EGVSGSFPGFRAPGLPAVAQSGTERREAQPFPLWTLVLAIRKEPPHRPGIPQALRNVVGTLALIIDDPCKPKALFYSTGISLNSQVEDHQLIVDVLATHFERPRFNPVLPEPKRLVKFARFLLCCRDHQKDLFESFNQAGAANHIGQDCSGHTFAA